jgi:HAD superfamily hydrolase (TIGR01509 family)
MAGESAVIFDLDGTLTKPYLNFDVIRQAIGLPSGPILEAMAKMPLPDRQQAERILHEHEHEGARTATLYVDALSVVQDCRDRGFATAILTGNARPSVNIILQRHGLSVDTIRTREDGPIKPSPAGILSICKELGADPHRSWMVGDFLFDILAGHAAGTQTVLMTADRNPPPFADQADHVIGCLTELLSLI